MVVPPLPLVVLLKRVAIFLLYWIDVQNVEVVGCRFSWPAERNMSRATQRDEAGKNLSTTVRSMSITYNSNTIAL